MNADEVIRRLVENDHDIRLMISQPEPGLVKASLLHGERSIGDLRMEAYEPYATLALSDMNGDVVLETTVFHDQDREAERNLGEMLSMIARLRDQEASPGSTTPSV